jgi:hypothetical protein
MLEKSSQQETHLKSQFSHSSSMILYLLPQFFISSLKSMAKLKLWSFLLVVLVVLLFAANYSLLALSFYFYFYNFIIIIISSLL